MARRNQLASLELKLQKIQHCYLGKVKPLLEAHEHAERAMNADHEANYICNVMKRFEKLLSDEEEEAKEG